MVGSFISKFVNAEKNNGLEVSCWGTGQSRRELIYCEDAAAGVVQVLDKYNCVDEPINIGFNEDISIKELAEKIAKLSGFRGNIVWDLTKSDRTNEKDVRFQQNETI